MAQADFFVQFDAANVDLQNRFTACDVGAINKNLAIKPAGAQDGLVSHKPNRGAFVAHITLAEARQIYAAWRLVEGTIIKALIPAITPEQTQTLKKLIAQERIACDQEDYPLLTRLSLQFHLKLAELSPNQYLGQFLKGLIPLTALAYFYDVKNMPLCTKDEHSQILDCIEAGDGEQAVAIAQQHLDGIEAALNAAAELDPQISLVDRLSTRKPLLSR